MKRKASVIKADKINSFRFESMNIPEIEDIPDMTPVKKPCGPIKKAVRDFLDTKDVKDFNKILEIADTLNRTIIIEEIDEESGVVAESLIRFWNRYDEENEIPIEEREPIKVYIDSPGGYLTSTFTIMDSIKLSKTPVWTINIGCAYSGGFFIFICGHKRIAYPTSSFLYHEGNGSVSGDANKFQNQADFYKKQRQKLKEFTLKYTKITEEQYNEHIKDDWWLFADEAIELGIADEIATEFI
jgi:ATP-dependent Clp protease protease subunit